MFTLLRACSRLRLVSRSKICWVVSLLLLLVLGASQAMGQAQNSGELTGNVLDSTKSAVPGAEVSLTSEDRGNVLTAKSNSVGEYQFTNVPQGPYRLTVVAPTFQKYVVNDVIINADSHVRQDAMLVPGNVSAEVTVDAATQTIDTQTAMISTVLDNNLVENLPIDGNNIVALAALLPGVTDVNAPTTFTNDASGPTYVVNGGRSTSNLFLFDGMLWNNLYQNTGVNYPNHIALQQVSILLNNYTAQYGRNAGSIFNAISKGGTNKLHGEGFLSVQNGALSADDYFTKTAEALTQYQFGATVGGPIVRDKLFFEAEYQELLSSGNFVAQAATPTYAERGLEPDGVTPRPCDTGPIVNGMGPAFAGMAQCASFGPASTALVLGNPVKSANYSQVAINQLNSTWIAEGHTGTNPCVTLLQGLPTSAYRNATSTALFDPEVPSVCFDPTIQAIEKHINLPPPTIAAAGTLVADTISSQPRHEYGGNLRVDWNAAKSHIVDIHFYKTFNNDVTPNAAVQGNVTSVGTYEPDSNQAFITAGSIGDTWTISANLQNVLRAGYKRYVYVVQPQDTTTLASLGAVYATPGPPELPALDVSGQFNLGGGSAQYLNNVNEDIEATDSLLYQHGSHTFQFGADFLRNQYQSINATPGTFIYNDQIASNTLAEFLMGLVETNVVGNNKEIAAIQHAIYSYAQDTWRASSRLSINYGVRYELPFEWYQPKGYQETFVPGYQSVRFPTAPAGLAFVGDPGVPRALIHTQYNNISPRIGLAYDVSGNARTVIRAGFGSFYDATPAQIVGIGQPFFFTATDQFPSGSQTYPLINGPVIPANYSPNAPPQFSTPQVINFPDQNFKNAYTFGFNAGFQHQLNKGTTLEMNYVGRLSRHLTQPFDLNPAIRDCSGEYYQANPSLYCYGGAVTSGAYVPEPAVQAAQINCTISTVSAAPTATNNCPSYNVGYTARLRYPNFNYGGQGVVDYASIGTANYNALQAIYTQRAYQHLTLTASYTYGKALDEQSNLSTSNATPNPFNVAASQYGLSDYYTKHIFNMGWRLTIPNTLSGNMFKRALLNDWSFNGIYNARTGHPVNLVFAGDKASFDETSQQRLVLAPGQSATLPSTRSRAAKIGAWFNCYQPYSAGTVSNSCGAPKQYSQTPALSEPQPGTLSNMSRNTIIGPAFINTQLSVTKDIGLAKVREGMHAQFRLEGYNVFNTVNLAQPVSSLNNSSGAVALGSITGDVLINGQAMRHLQFNFLFYF